MHHIISDGESMSVFFRELNELYMGRPLKATRQYGEFALTNGYTEENEKYWSDVYQDDIAPLDLKHDYEYSENNSFNGQQIYEFIDIATHNKIAEKCKEAGIRLL